MNSAELAEYFKHQLAELDWDSIAQTMHDRGFVVLEKFLTEYQCDVIKNNYVHPTLYRKTVDMQRYRFGLGEYKYFNYPLPHLIQQLRTQMYSYLMPIANAWFKALNFEPVFPETHQDFLQQCHEHGQRYATPLILKYRKDGFNTLHQDLYGEIYFPIQLVIFLSQVNVDYQGGEFVLTQHIPRAQSKVTVLQPQKGDVLIFTTQFKPEKGTRGYYRVNMKHGVSPLHWGERYTLGIIFHDAVR
ncbi:2OG-Fe(II) oxygenase [Acinetobacter sp. MB5]|uniref:2OG-Fe(II) oxygenase n=1 Tax=Acinetobacter sp. MB5 TaxID=2069438 RepID=UPI000DD0A5E3|nr:2OG-Fe(II) oxygenase [Acinetobacter sp. MB5]